MHMLLRIKQQRFYIKQTQTDKIFKLPFAIDIYEHNQKKRYKVWMDQPSDTFSFAVNSKPDLINVDADKILLCEKNDHKTFENFIYQYKNAGLYVDRIEAVEFTAKNQTDAKALGFLETALNDKSDKLRKFTLEQINTNNDTVKQSLESVLVKISQNDPKTIIRGMAIQILGKYKKTSFKPLFMKALTDSSYFVSGNALEALSEIDTVAAMNEAKILGAQRAKGVLMNALIKYSDESKFDSLASKFDNLPFGSTKIDMVSPFAEFITKFKNTEKLRKGVDIIVKFREAVPQQYHHFSDPFINKVLNEIAEKKQAAGMKEQADYIKSKLPAISK